MNHAYFELNSGNKKEKDEPSSVGLMNPDANLTKFNPLRLYNSNI